MLKRLLLGMALAFSFGVIWTLISHYFDISMLWSTIIAFILGVLGMHLSLCWYAGKEAND